MANWYDTYEDYQTQSVAEQYVLDAARLNSMVNRILKSPSEIYDIKDPKYFQATGDGVTDDTSAIQAGMNSLDNAGGGILYVPPGTYNVTTLNSIPNNIRIIGAGVKSVFTGSTSADTFFFHNVSSTQLANIKIANSQTNQGVRLSTCQDIALDNIWITNASGYGMTIRNSETVNVRNLVIDGKCSQYGIGIMASNLAALGAGTCRDINFENVCIKNLKGYGGVSINGRTGTNSTNVLENVNFRNLAISSVECMAFTASEGASNINLSNFRIANIGTGINSNVYGVYHESVNGFTIRDGVISNSSSHGIGLHRTSIAGDPFGCRRGVIDNVKIEDTKNHGIFLKAVSGTPVRDVTIQNCNLHNVQDGIWIRSAKGIKVDANRMWDITRYGIVIPQAATAQQITISNNLIKSSVGTKSPEHGIRMVGVLEDIQIDGNYVYGISSVSTGYGIYIWGVNAQAKNLKIRDNYCYDNISDGLYVRNVSGLEISNNYCTNNSHYGMNIGTCSTAIIQGNTCGSNGTGIYVDGGTVVNIKDNIAQSNSNDGIYVDNLAALNISHNISRNNTHYGMYIGSGCGSGIMKGNQAAGNNTQMFVHKSNVDIYGERVTAYLGTHTAAATPEIPVTRVVGTNGQLVNHAYLINAANMIQSAHQYSNFILYDKGSTGTASNSIASVTSASNIDEFLPESMTMNPIDLGGYQVSRGNALSWKKSNPLGAPSAVDTDKMVITVDLIDY